MNFENPGGPGERVTDPYGFIMATLQEIQTVGGVDYEIGVIKEILDNYKSGKITGEEAMRQAKKLQNERQER